MVVELVTGVVGELVPGDGRDDETAALGSVRRLSTSRVTPNPKQRQHYYSRENPGAATQPPPFPQGPAFTHHRFHDPVFIHLRSRVIQRRAQAFFFSVHQASSR